MKKMTLILALGLVFIIAGAAQGQMKMEFGIKAGGNMANLTGDVEGTSMKLGIGGGIFAKIMPSPQLTIQPEVLYMMKGAKHDDYDEGGISYTDGKSVIDYIEVPVLVKYMIPTEGKISPSVFAGPAVGFLMSAKDKYTMDGTEMEDDWKDYFKSIDFGVAFGAGVDVAMGEKGKLTFDARYTLGLTNLYDLTEDEATAMGIDPDASVKNANISVMVGYSFPIGAGE